MDLLTACQMAYRKHHLDDDSIGWDELSDYLGDALCNAMGDQEYINWLYEIRKKKLESVASDMKRKEEY